MLKQVRYLELSLLIIASLVATSCNGPQEALIHLTYPSKYRIEGFHMDSYEGYTQLYLTDGTHIIRFKKSGKLFGAMLNVQGGGEVYLDIEDKDFAPIIPAEEAR